ncbi:hypothetical protein DHD32_10170 [Arenibacter sp. TNZ]|nr:hypothetical protein [Arenibacter sp. TNZ]
MDCKELSKKLHDMYFNAPKGEMVAMIHLFGIKYAKEITANKFSKKEIAIEAGIPVAYQVEINKGVKLAHYVTVKPNF